MRVQNNQVVCEDVAELGSALRAGDEAAIAFNKRLYAVGDGLVWTRLCPVVGGATVYVERPMPPHADTPRWAIEVLRTLSLIDDLARAIESGDAALRAAQARLRHDQ